MNAEVTFNWMTLFSANGKSSRLEGMKLADEYTVKTGIPTVFKPVDSSNGIYISLTAINSIGKEEILELLGNLKEKDNLPRNYKMLSEVMRKCTGVLDFIPAVWLNTLLSDLTPSNN